LLYGATGNGKTALGTSVEEEFNMKFFTVKGSDILSKYIGGS
jgi:SpoVK/Ycf46/Vps4 family AAA+-type ATPase